MKKTDLVNWPKIVGDIWPSGIRKASNNNLFKFTSTDVPVITVRTLIEPTRRNIDSQDPKEQDHQTITHTRFHKNLPEGWQHSVLPRPQSACVAGALRTLGPLAPSL